jgi:hypothetical protein
MRGAVMNGLFGLNISTPFDCISSNCTYPGVYTTLGFESKCTNVTKTITRKCKNDNEGAGSTTTAKDLNNNCNITTPLNITLQSFYVPTEFRTAINISTAASADGCLETYNPNCGHAGNSSNLVSFAVYRFSAPAGTDFDKPNPWDVIECSISTVAFKHSNISIQNNSFKIGHEETLPLIRRTNNTFANDSLAASPMFLTTIDGSQSFKLNYNDWKNLVSFLKNKVFAGSIAGGNALDSNELGLAPSALFNADIDAITANIALSMTNRIRSSRNATLAQGEVWREVTFVIVQWRWLGLPLFTVFAAGAFLLVTALQTWRRGGLLWKSSNVALLSHRIIGWDEQDMDLVRGQGKLERIARDVKLRLSEDEHLRFVKVG